MPSPFPGMNPYLENPEFWSGVHHWLINGIARVLGPQLRPKYYVAVEVRVYENYGEDTTLIGIPDNVVVKGSHKAIPASSNVVAVTKPQEVTIPLPETIKEGYLEIRKADTKEVITAIEILSPKNKKPGIGRQKYEHKRSEILGSATNFVEIDLLRQGATDDFFCEGYSKPLSHSR